jgi:hypothetical protein
MLVYTLCEMNILIWTFLLQLIFSVPFAHAALDVDPSTVVEPNSETQAEPSDVSPAVKEMSIAIPPARKSELKSGEASEIFYPYQTSISPRLGWGSDSKLLSSYTFFYFFGFNYALPNQNGRHWEVGFDVNNDGTGVLALGKKMVANYNSAIRPYFKYGAAVKMMPSEQLNTLLKYENYQLRASAGFEYFLTHPMSARVDFEAFAALKFVGFQAVMGYSWAW